MAIPDVSGIIACGAILVKYTCVHLWERESTVIKVCIDSIDCMASITIRDIDDDVKERLRRRAAEHGRSMESEAREILAQAVQPRRLLYELYKGSRPYAAELDIPPQPEAGGVGF